MSQLIAGQSSIFDLLEAEPVVELKTMRSDTQHGRAPALYRPLTEHGLYCIWCGREYAGGYGGFDYSANHSCTGISEFTGIRECTAMHLTRGHISTAIDGLLTTLAGEDSGPCCYSTNDVHKKHIKNPTPEQWGDHLRHNFETACARWGIRQRIIREWYRLQVSEHGLWRYAQPPFKVNINVWQDNRYCGWCNGKSVIGGFALRHPDREEFSIFGSYCAKCSDRYGDPRASEIDLIINLEVKDRHPNYKGGHEQAILDTIDRWKASA